jgi:hypothetical protein
MAFRPIELSGRLMIATDGLFKYATESDIAKRAMGIPFSGPKGCRKARDRTRADELV